jgi:hypothetical protein
VQRGKGLLQQLCQVVPYSRHIIVDKTRKHPAPLRGSLSDISVRDLCDQRLRDLCGQRLHMVLHGFDEGPQSFS